MKKFKVGRNAPCPCGSGQKFKRCCGSVTARAQNENVRVPDAEYMRNMLRQIEAREKQRVDQQGYGHPIVSFESHGHRVVAVRNTLHWTKKPGQWKTFHDFLKWYIINTLQGPWAKADMQKPLEERHPILQWHHHFVEIQKRTKVGPNGIYDAAMTGAIAAYMGLAYNLYLIAHNNTDIQTRLIKRLQNPEQFHGVYYETYVAASFIKAGFELEYEDEGDGNSSHCEFTAISKASGKKYSVEAKTRAVAGVLGKKEGKEKTKTTGAQEDPNVRNQLYEALKKDALHPRVIFIDVNVPDDPAEDVEADYLMKSLQTVRNAEASMTINKQPAPPAYVVLTNHPYHYTPESTSFRAAAVFDSFKIEEFQHGKTGTLREAINARKKHSDMHKLMASMKDHYSIPATFDGENPEFAFGGMPYPRFIIGNVYLVPDGTGKEVLGLLEEALVMENEKAMMGIHRLQDGRRISVRAPLLDAELAAYRQHPTTFFGVYKPKQRIDTMIELYDFFYDTYRKSSHEKLLEFMKDSPQIEEFKTMSRDMLASIYSERMAINAFAQREKKDKG